MPEQSLFDLMQEAEAVDNQKSLARKHVDTYENESIVVHELLHNSLDAIQKAGRDRGEIELTLAPDTESIEISDNGCGFPPNVQLLLFGGTDKDGASTYQKSKGNLGIGLKAVYLSSSDFRLEAVTNGQRWHASLSDGFKFEETSPILRYDDSPSPAPKAPDGTRITITFPGDSVSRLTRELVETGVRAVERSGFARRWSASKRKEIAIAWYFRTRSYCADTNWIAGTADGHPPSLLVRIRKPSQEDRLGPEVMSLFGKGFTFEVTVPCKYWDAREVLASAPTGVVRARAVDDAVGEGGRIGNYGQNFIWVKTMSSRDEYLSLLKNPGLRTRVDPDEYERLLFDSLQGLHIVVGGRERLRDVQFEPPSQFVAVNGVPSAHQLQKPTLGGSLGYIANVHFVANVDATFNVGKQTITNSRLIGVLNRFFNDCYRATLKNIAKSIVGRIPREPEDEDDDSFVDYIALPNLPVAGLSFLKEPQEENGVIALFFELVGHDMLQGYQVYGLTGSRTYDGKFRARRVGQDGFRAPRTTGELRNIEFKLKLRSLISDFENETKNSSEIDLAVVWEDDLPEEGILSYRKLDLEESDYADRHYHRVSQVLHDSGSGANFQVLVLKEAVAEIERERQSSTPAGVVGA